MAGTFNPHGSEGRVGLFPLFLMELRVGCSSKNLKPPMAWVSKPCMLNRFSGQTGAISMESEGAFASRLLSGPVFASLVSLDQIYTSPTLTL